MKLSNYLILFITSLLIACGGGGGGSSSSGTSTTSTTTTTPSVGQFIDAPVSGLTYVCGSYSGTTNDLGQFNYSTDSTCSFTIGNVVVGSLSSIPSDGMVTPHDVAGVSRTADDDPNVQAIAQFLQSVGTSSGGVITISSTVRQNLQSAPANTAIFSSTGPLSQSALSNLVVMGAPAKTLIDSTVAKTAMKADIQQKGINTSIGVVKSGTPAKMSAVTVSSALTSIPQGLSTQLAASGNFTDGTTSVITNSVTWSSSNTAVATVNSRGLVTAVSTGTATITARTTEGFINTLLITVTSATLASITVTPATSNIARGLTQQMVASGTYSDGTSAVISASTVTWTSSSTAIATISSSGVVMGVALGSTTINATVGSVSASTQLAVSKTIQSISVTTANSVTSLPVGIAVQLTATGTLSDGSTVNLSNLVNWVASNNATVSSTGLFTGITASTVVPVTAAYVGVTSSAKSITLTNPILQSIAITATTSSTAPTASQAPAGYAQNLIATGTYSNGTTQVITTSITWSSATQSVATVTSGSAGGRVTGVATGTSVITATDSTSGVSKAVTFTVTAPALVSITVSAPSTNNPVGSTEQLVAMATYSDNSTANVSNTVAWTSSNTSIATVSSTGLLTTIAYSSTGFNVVATLSGISSATVSITTAIRSQVPFATPVVAGTVDPFASGAFSGTYFVGDSYTAVISGSGQDFITVGFQSCPCSVATHIDSRINMFSWRSGSLVDTTSQWFPNRTNEIMGSYAVKFADFFRSGRVDMITAPGADNSDLTGPAYLFINNGTSFSRTAINLGNNVNAQDVAIVDLNGDGYLDFIITDTGSQMTIGINNKVNNFTLYNSRNSNGIASASGSFIAVGDFLNNGTVTFVIDGGLYSSLTYNGSQVSKTGLYSWNIDANNKLTFTLISVLPQSRFLLPKWSNKNFTGGGESLGIVPIDINNDGKLDVALFSQPVKSGDNNYSEVQFMQNDGNGNFTDVTDTVLVGYNNNLRVSYVPRLIDINGDGLMDILASGGGGFSTQWLLKSSDGKYVATWAGQSNDFLNQTNELTGGTAASADHSNSLNFIKDPNGKLHLVTYVQFQGTGRRQLRVYTSLLGTPASGNSPQTASNLSTQAWPYLQSPANNPSLAATVQGY